MRTAAISSRRINARRGSDPFFLAHEPHEVTVGVLDEREPQVRVRELGDDVGLFVERNASLDEAGGGPDHPNVALSLTGLANTLRDLRRLEEAEATYRRALRIFDHAEVEASERQGTIEGLAKLLRASGREPEAVALEASLEAKSTL